MAMASDTQQYVVPGSGITDATDNSIGHAAHWQLGFGRRARLSSEILSAAVAAFDFCLVLIVGAATFVWYFDLIDRYSGQPGHYVLTVVFAATLFIAGFERLGGYQLKQLLRLDWQLMHIAVVWAATLAALLLTAFVAKLSESYSRGWALVWFICAPTVLLMARGVLHLAVTRWVRGGTFARNIVVVGAGREGQRLMAKLQGSQDKSIAVRGVFDDCELKFPDAKFSSNVMGTTDDLIRAARRSPVDEVIIALPLDAEEQLKALFCKLKGIATDLRLSIEPIAERFPVCGVSYVGSVPVFDIAERPLKHWRALAKWVEDKVLSALLLIFFGPLMAVTAMLIKVDSRGPVIFAQERFGFNSEVIKVLKFRTMYVDRGDRTGAQRTVHNDPRVTRVGRILRSLSIDELPQLMNVLRGDMSIVGPRPHAIAMKAGGRLYQYAVEEYFHRHRVKPGITGWAQVNGLRGEIDTLEKARARVAHDLHYIERWSPWLDLKILLKTAGILASRANAY
jgi:Undecaprenyl-phosphate glucose phosphotransferase